LDAFLTNLSSDYKSSFTNANCQLRPTFQLLQLSFTSVNWIHYLGNIDKIDQSMILQVKFLDNGATKIHAKHSSGFSVSLTFFPLLLALFVL